MRKFFVMIVALAAMAVPGAFADVASAGCVAWTSGATYVAGYPHLTSTGSGDPGKITDDLYYVGANCTGATSGHKFSVAYAWEQYFPGFGWADSEWQYNSNAPHFNNVGGYATYNANQNFDGTSSWAFTDTVVGRLWRGSELDSNGTIGNAPGNTFALYNCGGSSSVLGYPAWGLMPGATDIRLRVEVRDETNDNISYAYTNNTHLTVTNNTLPGCFMLNTSSPAAAVNYPV